MNIYRDFCEFEPWSGAVPVWERIDNEGKLDDLEAVLDELYPDGMSETSLNDLLRFESEEVFGWLGMRTLSEIEGEIQEKQERLEEIEQEIEDLLEEQEEAEDADGHEMIEDDIRVLREEYEEVEEEIKELEEEKSDY